MKLRSVICLLMGHVDHGKTKILENIAKVKIIEKEAGGITQVIRAINVNVERIKNLCGNLLPPEKIMLPGILLIDTPGHAAFTNLRKRGGNLADIAILVIDINEGLMPQTIECFEILKQYRTPFVIALNKIDLISGYVSNPKLKLLENLDKQPKRVKEFIDKKLYELVGKLYELGFNSERFDRVMDYTKQVAIIPCSAKTSEGIAELVAVIIGLAQKFLEESLTIDIEGPGKGTILEVVEEKGLGITLDVVLYEGKICEGDTIVIGALEKPIVAKIRALFVAEDGKLKRKKEIRASSSLKISAIGIENAIAGMPIVVVRDERKIEDAKRKILEEVGEVIIETEKEGIIVKADSLGSLEALIKLLKEKEIPIKRATIGNVTKKDLVDAGSESDPLKRVILGFNVKCEEEVENVKVILSDVIYKIIEEYEKWYNAEKRKIEEEELKKVVRPFEIKILRGCVFRQSNPAIVGIEVIAGKVKTDSQLMKLDGKIVGRIKSMQLEGENIQEAEKGKQVAIAIPEVTVGRQIKEDEILLSDITEEEFRVMKKLKKYLTEDEKRVLKKIVEIKRREKPTWGL